jgi:hypothetical protein
MFVGFVILLIAGGLIWLTAKIEHPVPLMVAAFLILLVAPAACAVDLLEDDPDCSNYYDGHICENR